MEWNRTFRNFTVILFKFFYFGLGILKSKFLGLQKGTVCFQGEESGKEWNGLVHSVPGFSSHPTLDL